ncbi:ATP-binding protein [Nocardia vinacea]|uniref:ATP-binding protein n=1 Tax=Nocardia vinacea TaxID=96468 RepID=UPI002E108CA4|nr:ATP-binding protein [Nocardia vinacea]
MRAPKVSLSLRARVALVSGLVAALVAITLGIAYTALLDATGSRQFDETVSTMGVAVVQRFDAPPHAAIPALPPLPPPPLPGPAVSGPVLIGPDGVRTTVAGAPGLVVRLDPDRALVDSAIRRSQLIGIAIGIAGVLLAALLGWFLAGYAARPLRRLATATHGIDTLEQLPPLSGRGAREAEELSDAISRMLARLEAAHGATNRALASARDFAAVCAHELRTPLTAMRTDLEVLATKELPAEQQRAVLADVLLAERQIENTLTDLEQLAVGELTESDAFEPFELCEILDRAVQDARRRHPEVSIDLTECTPTTLTGLPGGVMLIVTNAVANAVQHGHARTITVAARYCDPRTADANPADLNVAGPSPDNPSTAGMSPADAKPADATVTDPSPTHPSTAGTSRIRANSADPSIAGMSPVDANPANPKTSDQHADVRPAIPNTFRHNAADATAGVEIIIDDDGTGIPEALRANAFDRFIKGPGSPGSGLGLALVRQQAELHSGTAELDQSPLGGVRLRVRITASAS